MKRLRSFLVAAALFVSGCGPSFQAKNFSPGELNVSGPYRHPKAGVVFPDSVGTTWRTQMTVFSPDSTDIGATYLRQDPRLLISVFVYPAPKTVSMGSPPEVVEEMRSQLFLRHYESRKRSITQRNPNAFLMEDGDFVLDIGGVRRFGKRAVYKMAPADEAPLSALYLLESGKWLEAYRIDYLPKDQDEVDSCLHDLMRRIGLPGV